MERATKPYISIVIPIYNEEDNIPILWQELQDVFSNLPSAEVVMVDDGSEDKSLDILKKIAHEDSRLKIISFQRNYGQTIAMGAGVEHAKGKVIVMLDADLQNNPADIPILLKKLEEGYDVVSGWRKERWKGKWLSRKLPSIMANKIISIITGIRIHDAGCTLKAYRSEVIKSIDFLGEIHRLIHVYAYWQGALVTEIAVTDRPRIHGKSKYGFSRILKVPLDLLVAKFVHRYSTKPIYFFGALGMFLFIIGFAVFLVAIYLRFMMGISLIETPLLLLTALMFIVGMQLVVMGLLADMILRTRSQKGSTYTVKEKIGL